MVCGVFSGKWFERVQRKHLLTLVMLYAAVAFWGRLLKGVYDNSDICDYMRIGLNFWDVGFKAFTEGYANIAFSILAGGIVKITGIHEPYIISLVLSLPCLFGITLFFFMIVEHYTDSVWATFASLFLCATPAFAGALVRPLSEAPFCLLVTAAVYLTVVRKVRPLYVGLFLGAIFWFRNQILVFLPLWPLLFESSTGLKRYIRNGFLLGIGFIVGPLVYTFAQGRFYFFYTGKGNLTQFDWLAVFFDQLLVLNEQNAIAIYLLAIASIAFKSFRRNATRLYVFNCGTFLLQLFLIVRRGYPTRPGAYVVFFVLSVCLLTIVMRNEILPWLKRHDRKGVVGPILLVVLAVFLIRNAALNRIVKYGVMPSQIERKLSRWKLDRRYVFDKIEPDAVLASDTEYGFLWTRLSARKHEVYWASPKAPKVLPPDEPISTTIDLLNGRETRLTADYLVIWRSGVSSEAIDFPTGFQDRFGNHYELFQQDKSREMTLVLYKIN